MFMALKGRKTFLRKAAFNRRRQRRRLRTFFIIILLLMSAGLLVFGAVKIFSAEQFLVEHLVFEGAGNISEDDLRSAVWGYLRENVFFVLPKRNFLILDEKEISHVLLGAFPRVANAEVRKDIFSQTLFIEIKERTLWAVLCRESGIGDREAGTDVSLQTAKNELQTKDYESQTESDCFYVAEDGIAYERAPEFKGALITKIYDKSGDIVSVGSPALRDARFHIVRVFVRAAEELQEIEIVQFVFNKSNETIEIITGEEWSIFIDESVSPETALENLILSLREEIKEKRADLDYVDLRYGNKVYYKFRE